MNLDELFQFLKKKYPQMFAMTDSNQPQIKGLLNDLLMGRLDKDLNATLRNRGPETQMRLYNQNAPIKGPESQWITDPNLNAKYGKVM